MSEFVKIAFGALAAPKGGTYVVFVGADLKPSSKVAGADRRSGRAPRVGGQGGPLPRQGVDARWILSRRRGWTACGCWSSASRREKTASRSISPISAAIVFGKLGAAKKVAVAFVAPEGEWEAGAGRRVRAGPAAARLPLRPLQDQEGQRRRGRRRRAGGDDRDRRRGRGARRRRGRAMAVAEGVELARTLVNEPPNVLFPESFAERAAALKAHRRRSRGPRREGDGQARHERVARRRPGLEARQPPRRHALARAARAQGPSRSPSSARASASIRAASRSSRPPAWRT